MAYTVCWVLPSNSNFKLHLSAHLKGASTFHRLLYGSVEALAGCYIVTTLNTLKMSWQRDIHSWSVPMSLY